MTNREFFLTRWEAEFPAFVRVFKALPPDKLDYRPHPRSRSAAELVWLLAYEEQTGSELVDTGKIDWKETSPSHSLDQMIVTYEKAHADLGRRLRELDDNSWEGKKGKFIVNGNMVMEEPLGDFFWSALFDAIHHRGQLSTYIRPMGGKVPSIYGPSADDPGA
ncbi:MAG: hypothetical protein HY731_02985 [Candidatus Tectomicrobia bacterium]|nr:hypothetical protein [Candidatus Tectomicrobia bacterium]